jgi:hypothetical protein
MLSVISPSKKPDPLAWLRVSHVCHQWRDIVLNQPVFWSHVDFTSISSAGAAEILARAKTVPLYLEARGLSSHRDNTQFSAFQEELQLRVSHIRHLLINTHHFSDLRKTLKGLVSPAPTLESLSLSSESHGFLSTDSVPEALFGGTMPRLSCLELSNCDISWQSSLLKGLRYLEIRSPSANTRPSLSVWLSALDEMRQLKTLTLHSASPIAPPRPFPFEVQSTVALPSLTHLDISSSTRDCALALACLDLPALTWLCLEAIFDVDEATGDDIQTLLPYVVRHAHGPQDTQPLQSALIRDNEHYIDILAWTVPDIEMHDPLTLRTATVPTRVALSFTSPNWNPYKALIDFIGAALAALPFEELISFIVKGFTSSSILEIWLRNSPKWPLLRRIRLTPHNMASEFLDCLLADKGVSEIPLLPSLKELVLVDYSLWEYQTRHLCDALMKRVEQGVPLEMLDLRTCYPGSDYPAIVRLLSEIVVDVLGPEEKRDANAKIKYMWDRSSWPLRGPFVKSDNYFKETN